MKTIVISPHPDDEIFGVGGTLLRRKHAGGEIAWVIVTTAEKLAGWSVERKNKRKEEIKKITQFFSFDAVYELNFSATMLDQAPLVELINSISASFELFKPNEVFLPHYSDVHTDHQVIFDAVVSCTKWFRFPYVKKILAYETLSETDFGLRSNQSFRPSVFVDISDFIQPKLSALDIYSSELGAPPFPRSKEVVSALATVRGAASGFLFAEAFELLRERE